MNVLVTGIDGYIGSVLGPTLIQENFNVIGLDTGYYRNGWLHNSGFLQFPAVVNKDIRHINELDLYKIDAVIHLAELSNDPLGQLNQNITFKINHLGTVLLAQKCKELGINRFIYTSSCSVYGKGNDDFKTEMSETNPQTAYAKCKVMVEQDLQKLADQNFSPVFLRNATAYGVSPRMRFDLVLNNLAGLAWTIKQIRLISDGFPWRPLVHVSDICQAITCALKAPKELIHNQIFNVGDSNENFRVREIAEIVAQTFPSCELIVGKNDGDNRSYRVSFDKINSQLPGFKCNMNIKKGAQELQDIFKKIDMKKDTFEFRAFTRVEQIKYLLKSKQIDKNLFWI